MTRILLLQTVLKTQKKVQFREVFQVYCSSTSILDLKSIGNRTDGNCVLDPLLVLLPTYAT